MKIHGLFVFYKLYIGKLMFILYVGKKYKYNGIFTDI